VLSVLMQGELSIMMMISVFCEHYCFNVLLNDASNVLKEDSY